MNGNSVLGVLAAGSLVLALSACTGPVVPLDTAATPAAPSAAAAAHNAADVDFVRGMIPHHVQAVAMAEQASGRAGRGQVKQLAARIEQGQGPEIAQMRGFLAAWGAPENGAAMSGMDHGGTGGMAGMSGMMTDAQVQQLGQARGAAFDRLFLQMMVEHHTGAIQMARTELSTGQNPEAKTLARAIIDAQQSEITEMQGLLKSA